MRFIKIGKNRFNRDYISVYGEHHGDSSRSFLNIDGAAGDGEFIFDMPIAELEAIIFGPDYAPSLPAATKQDAELIADMLAALKKVPIVKVDLEADPEGHMTYSCPNCGKGSDVPCSDDCYVRIVSMAIAKAEGEA